MRLELGVTSRYDLTTNICKKGFQKVQIRYYKLIKQFTPYCENSLQKSVGKVASNVNVDNLSCPDGMSITGAKTEVGTSIFGDKSIYLLQFYCSAFKSSPTLSPTGNLVH